MMDGTKVCPIPVACDRNSCHQPQSTPRIVAMTLASSCEASMPRSATVSGSATQDREEKRARQQRWGARGTTQAFPERSRGSHGQTKKP